MTQDVAAILARAALPTDRYRWCLDAALHARWQAASAEAGACRSDLQRARDAGSPVAAAAKRLSTAETEAERLRGAVEATSLVLTLRALPFDAYNALFLSHPPREGVKGDQAVGHNPIAFAPALIEASTVDPHLTAEQWRQVWDVTTDAQLDQAYAVVVALNRAHRTAVPFPPSSQPSDETSG